MRDQKNKQNKGEYLKTTDLADVLEIAGILSSERKPLLTSKPTSARDVPTPPCCSTSTDKQSLLFKAVTE